MKATVLYLFLFIATATASLGQTTVPADKVAINYCEANLFKSGVGDFTVSIKFESDPYIRLKDAGGKDAVFKTLPAFLSWMEGQGWVFFQFNPYIDPLERELNLFQKVLFRKK